MLLSPTGSGFWILGAPLVALFVEAMEHLGGVVLKEVHHLGGGLWKWQPDPASSLLSLTFVLSQLHFSFLLPSLPFWTLIHWSQNTSFFLKLPLICVGFFFHSNKIITDTLYGPELRIYIYTKFDMQTFIRTTIIIKYWKQQEQSSGGKCMNRMQGR